MAVKENEMLFATQIAYANLDTIYKEISEKNEGGSVSLKEVINKAYQKNRTDGLWGHFEGYLEMENGQPVLDEQGYIQFKKEYDYIDDWQILAITNDNENTGFCACILDTGEDRILACRGSEAISAEHMNDWINDVSFLSSIQTEQDKKLMEFMQQNRSLLEEKNWYATGHSLGGALSDYAAILSAELKIDNFSGSINFDGPGRSPEFMETYKNSISEVCDLMTHKKASLVGNLLNDIPGVSQDFIEVSHTNRLSGDFSVLSALTPLEYVLLHDTTNWVLDASGNTIKRDPAASDYAMQGLSQLLNLLPGSTRQYLAESVVGTLSMAKWVGDLFSDQVDNGKKAEMLAKFCEKIITDPGCIIDGAVDVGVTIVAAAGVLIDLGIAKAGDFVQDVFSIVKSAVDLVCDGVDWLKGKATEVFEAACNAVKSIGNWFNEKINKGVGYSRENPYIRADPAKLREYAYRLDMVNRRISALDRGMNDLYWQVGLLDLLDILQANLLTHYSWNLQMAKNYLYNTAERLETAERNAQNYLGG